MRAWFKKPISWLLLGYQSYYFLVLVEKELRINILLYTSVLASVSTHVGVKVPLPCSPAQPPPLFWSCALVLFQLLFRGSVIAGGVFFYTKRLESRDRQPDNSVERVTFEVHY